MKLLEGKVAIITGASRGIGSGIAKVFAQHGANVAFTYSSSAESALALENELSTMGIKAKGYKSNAADFNEAQKLVDDVMAEFGNVDILINNAGITKDNLLMRMSEEDFDKVIEINLKSVFNMTKAVQKIMLKNRKGSIVNMSSVVGVKGNAGQANYAAANAFLDGMAKYRRSLGLPGLSINWGPFDKAGMAARISSLSQPGWEKSGLHSISPEIGLALISAMLSGNS